MNSPSAIALLFLVLVLGVWSALYYPRYVSHKAAAGELAALLAADAPLDPLAPRTKASGCVAERASPDPSCTPGAVFANATLERICVPGYTREVRSVSEKLRRSVFREYGIPYPQPRGSYEVDHLIPLALGGNNDIANLFPQEAKPAPGFPEKDLVEVYLREEVCAFRVDPSVAQARIASDWPAIYNDLPSDVIARLRSEYRNWSN